mgnify:CR=1 FL=1
MHTERTTNNSADPVLEHPIGQKMCTRTSAEVRRLSRLAGSCWNTNNAHAGSRTRVTSMGGLYDAATLHALVIFQALTAW